MKQFLFLAPLCPKPPDAPDEGIQEYLPIPIPIDPEEMCGLDDEDGKILL